MLLNNNREFVFLKNSIEHRPDTFAYQIIPFTDADYYYVEFFMADAFRQFPIESIVPLDILNRIRSREVTLILHNSHEAFHSIVPDIYQNVVINSEIPPEQILLVTESADILDVVRKVSTDFNLGMLKCAWIRMFECSTRTDVMFRGIDASGALLDKPYAKKYINFNRRWRGHRPTLVALLSIHGLLSAGHVSLGEDGTGQQWANAFHHIIHQAKDSLELTKILEDHRDEILALPPLYVDTPSLVQNEAVLNPQSLWVYENSYFNVVSETNYYTKPGSEPGRFFSEKTFKPIAMRQPFIIVSVPRMLPMLRSIGYKTFEPWIDESYDNELDDSTRMLKIVAEIKRLVELTPAALTEFLQAVRPICDHNRQTLLNKTSHIERLN